MGSDVSRIPLHRLAHGRAGDKGNTSNISVIAYHQEHFALLVEQVTVERVAAIFRDRAPKAVRRYLLPKLGAMNFVLEGVLDGGVENASSRAVSGSAPCPFSRSRCVPGRLYGSREDERGPRAWSTLELVF